MTATELRDALKARRRRISRGAGLVLALAASLCLWWLIYRAAESFILPWVR